MVHNKLDRGSDRPDFPEAGPWERPLPSTASSYASPQHPRRMASAILWPAGPLRGSSVANWQGLPYHVNWMATRPSSASKWPSSLAALVIQLDTMWEWFSSEILLWHVF